MRCQHCTKSAAKLLVAGYLARLREIVRDSRDVASSTTVESSKDIRKALVDFEEEIDCRELTFSWNGFTMLVIIAHRVGFSERSPVGVEYRIVFYCSG